MRSRYFFATALVVAASAAVLIPAPTADAHRSGCHRWHSCPSDYDTYEPGDLGYPVQYPGNCGWVNCGGESPYSGSGASSSGSGGIGSVLNPRAPEGGGLPWFWIVVGGVAGLWVVSKIPGWRRERARETAERKRHEAELREYQAQYAGSSWIGTVGDSVEIRASVRRVGHNDNYSYYGGQYRGHAVYRTPRTAYELEDLDGNALAWFTDSTKTALEEGKAYVIRANVKAHETVNGVQRTVLTRVRKIRRKPGEQTSAAEPG